MDTLTTTRLDGQLHSLYGSPFHLVTAERRVSWSVRLPDCAPISLRYDMARQASSRPVQTGDKRPSTGQQQRAKCWEYVLVRS